MLVAKLTARKAVNEQLRHRCCRRWTAVRNTCLCYWGSDVEAGEIEGVMVGSSPSVCKQSDGQLFAAQQETQSWGNRECGA